ncbi:porin family protein [Taibaiella koreensis]|uniref:porin family protein n=1 Tax=Taibaiella koreensis TaxID=1268548 RepID=UPI0013C36B11|nr:porin family protein [Taibaiella koreensis]
MKKLMLTLAAAVALSQAHAQITIAPEAGLNLANASISSPVGSPGTSMRPGLKAGAVVEIPVIKGFFIQPGIFYAMKGLKSEASGSVIGFPVAIKQKIALNYIEVPLNLGYRYYAGNAGSLFVTAGPYLGYALSGKSKVEGNVAGSGVDREEDIDFGSKDTEMKALDFGLNFSAGYQLPIGLYARIQYGFGLTNLYNASGTSYKNNVLSITLGYAFTLGK